MVKERNKTFLARAEFLMQALPFMQRYRGETVVIKFGGHAMINDELFTSFARDVLLLKQVGIHPIIVHGGGPKINEMLKKLAIESNFIDGLRVTDAASIEIVSMVLNQLNKRITSEIVKLGGQAIGICGADGGLMRTKAAQPQIRFCWHALRD